MDDSDVEIRREVHIGELRWPGSAIASGADGDAHNRLYKDMRGYSRDEAGEVLEIEEALLRNEREREKLEERLFEMAPTMVPLDCGVVSTVLALSAAGCVPITSCSGGQGHSEPGPVVVFRARPALVRHLLEAAEESECGLVNADDGMLAVYAVSIDRMLGFARSLIGPHRSIRKARSRSSVSNTRSSSGARDQLPLWNANMS